MNTLCCWCEPAFAAFDGDGLAVLPTEGVLDAATLVAGPGHLSKAIPGSPRRYFIGEGSRFGVILGTKGSETHFLA